MSALIVISYRSIDLGFDPRAHDDMICRYPDWAGDDPVRILTDEASRDCANRAAAIAFLRAQGFRVEAPPRGGGTSAPDTDPAVLTLADPNDNSGARHQYRVADWLLLHRRLPPIEIGDRWRDDAIDEPWWEPVLQLPPGGVILDFWAAHADLGMRRRDYARQARGAARIVAYTPNGREVRLRTDGAMEVQRAVDNYWVRVPDLRAARRAYYRGLR